MRILLFGPTGMVGEGVLRYVLDQPEVTAVTAVTRRPLSETHPKLTQMVQSDLFAFAASPQLAGFDACLFCLGISSVGMKEAEYRRTTKDLTLHVAQVLLPLNPGMVFEYISGEGTDTHGKQMWARVKGETEDALLTMGFRDAYMLRPGMIERNRGLPQNKGWIKWLYLTLIPLMPLFRHLPKLATSTDRIGKTMLYLARTGWQDKRLNTAAINAVSLL